MDVHETLHSEVRQHLQVIMPLPPMTGRRGQERLLRRACRGDAEIGNVSQRRQQAEEEETTFHPIQTSALEWYRI